MGLLNEMKSLICAVLTLALHKLFARQRPDPEHPLSHAVAV